MEVQHIQLCLRCLSRKLHVLSASREWRVLSTNSKENSLRKAAVNVKLGLAAYKTHCIYVSLPSCLFSSLHGHTGFCMNRSRGVVAVWALLTPRQLRSWILFLRQHQEWLQRSWLAIARWATLRPSVPFPAVLNCWTKLLCRNSNCIPALKDSETNAYCKCDAFPRVKRWPWPPQPSSLSLSWQQLLHMHLETVSALSQSAKLGYTVGTLPGSPFGRGAVWWVRESLLRHIWIWSVLHLQRDMHSLSWLFPRG